MTDEYDCPPETRLWDIEDIVDEKLARIRLGVYSEEMDGTLQGILEEIERILMSRVIRLSEEELNSRISAYEEDEND